MWCFNPTHAAGLFLFPLEILENLSQPLLSCRNQSSDFWANQLPGFYTMRILFVNGCVATWLLVFLSLKESTYEIGKMFFISLKKPLSFLRKSKFRI